MKKRLLSLLLAMAMVASMVVMPANAQPQEENITPLSGLCPCGCGQLLTQIDWRPWKVNVDDEPPTGHYYLDGDYAQDKQIKVISGSRVVLDLRGNTLTSKESGRAALVEGYLGVMDTVGGGIFQSKTTGTAYGGVVMVRMNETNGSTFELFSGTVTVDPDNKGSLAGGVIYVSGDQSTFRMHGGMVTGGCTTKHGGNIAVATADAKAEILGGIIMEGDAATSGGSIYSIGTTVLKNCRILGGTATNNGGNIYQSGGSLTMENCEIAYGSAHGDGGGNLYVTGSTTFTDTGSTIRDGYADGSTGNGGGNIFFGAGTHTLNGTTVRGGVSRKYGANILNWTATTTRMIDCNIDGDVRWSGKGLSLEGKTRIGLRSNGLNLVGGSAGGVISASKLTDGAEIFVSAHWGTFTNDEANLDYFKPALRTVLSKNADGTLSGNDVVDAEGGYCPHCYDPANPKKVIWQAYTATTDSEISQSGHYYLNKSATARLNIAANTDVVIDLNGLNITSGHRCLVLKKGATLSLLDFNGAGKVTGKGGHTAKADGTVTKWRGGVIYGEGASNLNIYGGTYIYTSQAEKHITEGGVLYMPAGSNVKIYGGSIDGSSYNNTTEGYVGGAVAMADSAASFTMSAGRVIGGNAYQAGSMDFGEKTKVEITGGVVSGGSATNGIGNVRFAGASGAKGTVTVKDCAMVDGTTVASYSGNMHIYYYTAELDNCYFYGGVSETACGGNITCSTGSTTTASDVIIVGGKAAKGGNLYTATVDAKATFTDCLILSGEAIIPEGSTAGTDGNGGNLFANNGVITFRGGILSNGRAQRSGGNLHNNAGNNTVGNKVVFADGVQVTGGEAGAYGGNLHLPGVTELNSVYVAGGQAKTSGSDLYLSEGAKTALTLGEGLSGKIAMAAVSALMGDGVYGKAISAVSASAFSAELTMEKVAGHPKALAQAGKLVVAGASVVDARGEENWCVNNAAAVAACGKGQYVKLYTDKELVLTKDLTVDFNGQTVAVSGEYTLSGMDSSGDGYATPAGKVTGAASVAPVTYTEGGRIYLPVAEGNTVVFHRLGMALTDIVLRPDEAGIYYQASWTADETVRNMISSYGIVTSLAHMPDAAFRNDKTCESASFTGQIENGAKQCGVLIKDIMRLGNETAQNKKNGEMPIYATAYVTLTDGTTIVSDKVGVEDDVQYSLYDFMSYLDAKISTDPTHFRELEKRTKEFYGAWENKGMGQWQFNRLKAPEDPADDGILNVLMIGASGCYYYVEELYALLKEAGIESRICNVYYSGCLLKQHYNWWTKDISNYQFFVTDAEGRRRAHRADEPVSLEYCLAAYNWDVITLQESGAAALRVGETQALLAEREVYLTSLYGYLGQEFPQAELMWHENRAFSVGYNGSLFKVTSLQDQAEDTRRFRAFAQAVSEKYDVRWIPYGEGLQYFREDSGLPDTLTARLGYGTNHEGDYYHDGDIGGGQLLTACVWFECLTGLSCLDSNYVPVYTYNKETFTLSNELVTAIRAAAHKAVQNWFLPQ